MSKPVKRIVRFNPAILSVEDFWRALSVLRYDENIKDTATRLASLENAQDRLRKPSAVIHDDDGPIMYRWHIVPRNSMGGVYFHIQVRSDSIIRGPHDHEYDSFSTMIGGGPYTERQFYIDDRYNGGPQLRECEPWGMTFRVGQTTHRRAAQLHYIELPPGVPYSMTIFAHGPRIRKWGFANQDGTWVPAEAVGEIVDGTVMAKGRAAT